MKNIDPGVCWAKNKNNCVIFGKCFSAENPCEGSLPILYLKKQVMKSYERKNKVAIKNEEVDIYLLVHIRL